MKSLFALCLMLSSACTTSPEVTMAMQKMTPEQLLSRHKPAVVTGKKIEISYIRYTM